MKKLFRICLIMFILFPMIAYADTLPSIREFEAEVISDTGLTVKDNSNRSIKFKKGETIIITGSGNSYQVAYKNNRYNIKAEDYALIKPKNNVVNPNDENVYKLDKTREFEVVIDKLDVYSGPASIYEKVGHIPKGDQVTAFYAVKSDTLSDYFYIQEEELKGWIYIGNGSKEEGYSVREVNATTLKAVMTKELTLYNTQIKANTVETIYYWANPFNTTVPIIKINNEMVTLDDIDSYTLINEGKKRATSYGKKQFNILFKKETNMYSTMKGSEVLETIPANTELSTINLVPETVIINNSNTIDVLVFFNNKLGWVRVSSNIADFIDEDELVAPYTDLEGDDEPEPTTEVEEEKEDNTVKVNKKKILLIVIIAIVGIICASILLIFILERKGKKSTLDEINEELEKVEEIKKDTKKEDK